MQIADSADARRGHANSDHRGPIGTVVTTIFVYQDISLVLFIQMYIFLIWPPLPAVYNMKKKFLGPTIHNLICLLSTQDTK